MSVKLYHMIGFRLYVESRKLSNMCNYHNYCFIISAVYYVQFDRKGVRYAENAKQYVLL